MKYPEIPKWQLVALPLVMILVGVFYYGKYYVADELIKANRRIQDLQHDLLTAHELLDEERARATVAEREADVVRRANDLLRQSERQRQDEIAGLQADLEFYRRLGGANGAQAPLAVRYLELQPTQSPRVFRVNISLTQNLRRPAAVAGSVQLAVEGILNRVAKHLSNEQLVAEPGKPLSFQFEYFQQLEQLITLPEGFEPSRLTIQLKSNSLKDPVVQSMEWDSLLNQNATAPATD